MSASRYTLLGCSCLAASAAIRLFSHNGGKEGNHHSTLTSTTSLTLQRSLYINYALLVAGTSYLVRAIGRIKIGITRKLGTPCKKKKNGRRLGLLERWYVAHSRSGHHTGFSVAMELECGNGNGDMPTIKQVRGILKRISMQFPWLRAKLCRDGVGKQEADCDETLLWGDDLYVTITDDTDQTDPFELQQVSVSQDDSFGMAGGLAQVLEQQGRTTWNDDSDEPLWRAILVQYSATVTTKDNNNNNNNKFALVLSFHHLITDGMGAVAVMQAIVEASASEWTSHTTSDTKTTTTFPPPMEDVLDTVPRLSHLVLPVLLDRFPSLSSILRPPHFQGLPHSPMAKATDRTCNMLCLSLLNDRQVSTLRDACRQHDATVNSVCVAALCRAMTRHVTLENKPDLFSSCKGILPHNNQGIRLKIITAVNERPSCGVSNCDLGVYLVGPQTFLNVSTSDEGTNLMETATSYQAKLRDSKEAARMDMGLCKFISEDWVTFSKKHANRQPNGREDSLEVSNLGCVSFEKHATTSKGWRVNGVWFAQGRNVTGPALTCTMASSVGGLRVVLSAVPQAFPRESLVAIGKSFQAELVSFLNK